MCLDTVDVREGGARAGSGEPSGKRDRVAAPPATVDSHQHVLEHRGSSEVAHEVSLWTTALEAIGATPHRPAAYYRGDHMLGGEIC